MQSITCELVDVIIKLLFSSLTPAVGFSLSEEKVKYLVTQLRPFAENPPVFRQGSGGGESRLAIRAAASIDRVEKLADAVFGLQRGFKLGTAKVPLVLK